MRKPLRFPRHAALGWRQAGRITAAIGVLTVLSACDKQLTEPHTAPPHPGSTAVANPENPDKEIPEVLHNTPITYTAHVGNGTFAGEVGLNAIFDPSAWDYYSFCAEVNVAVSIETHRTTSAADPAQTLFFGTTGDSDGLSPAGSTNPDMTFLSFTDDNNGIPHGVGGAFADPRFFGVLPSAGLYTLAVYDFLGAGPGPVPYEIHIEGLVPTTPTIVSASATPSSVWPPNHKYFPVDLTVQTGDPCDPAPVVSGTIISSEPDDATGNGDGATTGDILVGGTSLSSNAAPAVAFQLGQSIELRAERAGEGPGREYRISLVATNRDGGTSAPVTLVVSVPHDQALASP